MFICVHRTSYGVISVFVFLKLFKLDNRQGELIALFLSYKHVTITNCIIVL